MPNKPSVLITGASTGIGAVYADRFAKRRHDLVLVARNRARMETLADRLRREIGVEVDILRADLTDPRDLAQVEARLREDRRIGILVNNAGTAPAGGFTDQSPEEIARIVNLNATAPARLASAVAPQLGPKGVYVQAVLPAATRTAIWEHAGKDVDKLPAVMEVDELVDAALVGFDRRETVTVPPLPDTNPWNDFEATRKVMIPNFNRVHAAERYRTAA